MGFTSIQLQTLVHVPAAVWLYIGHSQQHDAGGRACSVDGAERGQGLHSDSPVCGAHCGPGAGWRQSGHIKGNSDLYTVKGNGDYLKKCPTESPFLFCTLESKQ